jgi:hypothetical protein
MLVVPAWRGAANMTEQIVAESRTLMVFMACLLLATAAKSRRGLEGIWVETP